MATRRPIRRKRRSGERRSRRRTHDQSDPDHARLRECSRRRQAAARSLIEAAVHHGRDHTGDQVLAGGHGLLRSAELPDTTYAATVSELNWMQRYAAAEIVESGTEAGLSRREMLVRLAAVCGSVGAASTFLAACSSDDRRPPRRASTSTIVADDEPLDVASNVGIEGAAHERRHRAQAVRRGR